MVTQMENASVSNEKIRSGFVGLSTDTKPTNVGNGSTYFAMDTKKAYMFDEENSQWREI